MTESSVRVKSLVDEVNLGSQEQARGMDQIARVIVQMEKATQSTEANAEAGAASGQELNNDVRSLQELVHGVQAMLGAKYGASIAKNRPSSLTSSSYRR
jgi:methyl-accepting chemotaxis protein